MPQPFKNKSDDFWDSLQLLRSSQSSKNFSIMAYDRVKFYTIVQFVRKNSGLPKMIEVIPIISGTFAFALVVFSYNCPNLVNIIILRWQPTVPAINSQQSANYRLTDTEIWLKVVRMSNTSVNFFLNTYQLSGLEINFFVREPAGD